MVPAPTMGEVRLCPGLLPSLCGALDREECGWLTGVVLPDSTLVCSSIAKASEQDMPPGAAYARTLMHVSLRQMPSSCVYLHLKDVPAIDSTKIWTCRLSTFTAPAWHLHCRRICPSEKACTHRAVGTAGINDNGRTLLRGVPHHPFADYRMTHSFGLTWLDQRPNTGSLCAAGRTSP